VRRILPVLALVAAAVSAPLVVSAGTRNGLSLDFSREVLDAAGAGGLPGSGLAGHARAELWLAARALDAGDWPLALDHALPLAIAGDFLAGQYAARAYEGLGALAAAIDLLHATGGVGELLRIGLAAHRAGDLETARRAYAAAWELDPRLATDRLALVLADLGRPEEVEQVFLSALEQVGRYDRRTPGWQRGLARLYAEQERWVEAVGAYEAALATAGYDPAFDVGTVYYEIAWAYSRTGRHADAVAAIEIAVELDPSATSYLRLGAIHEAAGRPDLALAAYRQVLDLNPDSRPAQEAVERLEAGG